MSAFLEYLFKAQYIVTYNKMNGYKYTSNLYVEDSSDIWFWEKFIERLFPNTYNVIPWSKRGKCNLASYYTEAKVEALIAVDSDFDYICHNIGYNDKFHDNLYVLHTFAYNRESVLIEKDNIQKFLSDIKISVSHDVRIDLFIDKFSEIVFEGLVDFIYIKNFREENISHDNFDKCFHITDKEIIIVNERKLPVINMEILDEIPQKFQDFFNSYSISLSERLEAKEHLNALGVNSKNAYRFINGHKLEDLIIKIVEKLTSSLLNLELEVIKKDFSGAEIEKRKRQAKKTLDNESQIQTYLRRYIICEQDEIHQKICNKISLIKPIAS